MKTKKPRPIKELLIIMRDNLNVAFGKTYYIKGNDFVFGGILGLCPLVGEIMEMGLITGIEQELLAVWLKRNLPIKRVRGFCWYPGLIPPRKKWLNKQINKL